MATHPNARAPRASEERQERRRRRDGTLDRMQQLTMAVPDEVRASHPEHDFRWFNDSGSRMYDKTQLDDWDRVAGVEGISVGTDREGKPMKAYLCKKRKEFIAEDNARKESEIREQELGLIHGAREADADLPETVAYVPEGKNSINRLRA